MNACSCMGGVLDAGIPVWGRQPSRTCWNNGTTKGSVDGGRASEVPMRHTGSIRETLVQCVLDAGGDEGRTGARVLEEAGNGRERNEREMTTCTAAANGGTGGGDADTHTQRTTDALPEGTPSGEEGGGGYRPGRPDMQCQHADPVFALCSGDRSRARAQGCGVESEDDEKADDHPDREGGNSDHDWCRDAGGQSEKDGGEHMRLRSSGDETAPRAERD